MDYLKKKKNKLLANSSNIRTTNKKIMKTTPSFTPETFFAVLKAAVDMGYVPFVSMDEWAKMEDQPHLFESGADLELRLIKVWIAVKRKEYNNVFPLPHQTLQDTLTEVAEHLKIEWRGSDSPTRA